MAEKKTTKKEAKEYSVLKSSVGSQIGWKGEVVILNNGLTQKMLKEMFEGGLKCIVKNG